MMNNTLLIALAVVALAAPVRAQSEMDPVATEINTLLDRLDADTTDPAAPRRALVIRVALGMSRDMRYKFGGSGSCNNDLECFYDCSGYVAAVLQPAVHLPRASANDMYKRSAANGAITTSEPKPGDVLFFQDRDTNKSGVATHTGIYLDNGRFVHMFGKRDSPVRISSFSGYANSPGAKDKFNWHSILMAKADLSALPESTAAEFALARKAAAGAKIVKLTPGEPGGVYISPELVFRAMSLDRRGVLDALEAAVLDAKFDENPVQELPIEIPSDFDR